MRALLLCALLASVAGCRCRGGTIDPTELGFRVETTELDFGRVLEGDVVEREVIVAGTGVPDIAVEVATDAPFSAQPVVPVPGGATTTFPVKFTAGSIPVTGELRLSANGGNATVKLKGVGVRPKVCIPSAACKRSSYSLELDACVETEAPEGAECQPDSVCLEKGECRVGVCQGVARTCDDKDACTIDSCAMDLGCRNTPRACPAPTQPCRVAACDPMTGCGEATAPDGMPCGTVDCVKALLCVAGACVEVPTPEGFVCGPATPCRGESKCRNQTCVAPDAGVMTPRTVVRLTGAVVDERPSILAQSGNIYFQLCGLPLPPDAGVDAGGLDAGVDGGLDGGFDGGLDGGVDGGLDGGVDAGPAGDGGYCALASFTGTGFERWRAHYPDLDPRRLIQAGPKGVVLLKSGALELRLLSTGAGTLIPLEGEAVPRGVAQTPELELWALVTGDGGTKLVRWGGDGGVLPSVALDAGVTLLAVDEQGAAWLYSPDAGTLGRLQPEPDAGWSLQWHSAVPGLQALTTSDGIAFAGGQHLVRADDGGVFSFSSLDDGGAPRELLERLMVNGEGTGVAFYRQCSTPVMSCQELDKATWLQAFSLTTGQFLWRARVLPVGLPGRVEEVALTGLKPGAIATLLQVSFDGGSQAYLMGFAEGSRVLECPMPEGTTFGGAVFTPGSLHTLVTRDGGAWQLETYDIGPLPLMTRGWPQADSVSGTRRAR